VVVSITVGTYIVVVIFLITPRLNIQTWNNGFQQVFVLPEHCNELVKRNIISVLIGFLSPRTRDT
jgi:hypothetical protein